MRSEAQHAAPGSLKKSGRALKERETSGCDAAFLSALQACFRYFFAIQGLRATRWPLATLCRASGAAPCTL